MGNTADMNMKKLIGRLDAAVLDGRVEEADALASALYRLQGGADTADVMPAGFPSRVKSQNVRVEKERHMKPKSFKRICYIVAAAAVVTALSITAVATDFFGIRDMVIRDDTSASEPAPAGAWPVSDDGATATQVYNFGVRDLLTQDDTPASEPAPSDDWTPENAVPSTVPGEASGGDDDMIIPQGPPDSPEFLAAVEWRSYINSVDEDSDTNEYTEKYRSYSVYTQDMADKLEEIATKYDLTLHESQTYVYNAKELVYAAGTCDFLTGAAYHSVSGVAYTDGTFIYNGEVALQNGKQISYQFNNFVKGTLSQAYLSVGSEGDADGYREWVYKTQSGVDVLLALSERQALLFANLENTFVTINIMAGTGGAGTPGHAAYEADAVTDLDLEAFADLFDFSAIKAADTPIDPPKHDLIVLQGYPDSPEFKATEEWRSFCSHYDEDGSIIAEVGNDPNEYTERYPMYLVYSKDMARQARGDHRQIRPDAA